MSDSPEDVPSRYAAVGIAPMSSIISIVSSIVGKLRGGGNISCAAKLHLERILSWNLGVFAVSVFCLIQFSLVRLPRIRTLIFIRYNFFGFLS